jgi:hypothetical protein
MASMPSDSDTLPLLPSGNTTTYFIDNANNLVAGNAWILDARPLTFFGKNVAVADATSVHRYAYMSRIGVRNLALNDLEVGSWCRNLRNLHWLHSGLCSCHNSPY